MTPLRPQSWFRRRLGVAAVFLGITVVLSAWVLEDALSVTLITGAYLAIDWAGLALIRTFRRENFSLEMSLRRTDESDSLIAGGVIQLVATIRAREPVPTILVTPLLPPTMTAESCDGALVRLRPGEGTTVTFHVRTTQPGRFVFPGILLRAGSSMRLFSRTLLLTDARELAVIPDYESATSSRIEQFLRPERRLGQLRRHLQKGLGSDFCELREYRFPDPMSRVDWKATARTRQLVVREFEEPRDFTVRVILDGSLDMVHDGFAHAAAFVTKLAFVANAQGMRMVLTVYDRSIIVESRSRGGVYGFRHIVGDLISVPRLAFLAAACNADHEALSGEAEAAFRRSVRRWRGTGRPQTLAAFLDRYLGAVQDEPTAWATFLADLSPDSLYGLAGRCTACGTAVFADEHGCPRCGSAEGDPVIMPPRAGCLAGTLERAMATARGREMLVVVSSLTGGEACSRIADALALAAAGHRTVHVVLPTIEQLADLRPEAPGSLGHQPSAVLMLGNMEKLADATRFGAFRDELLGSGIHVHRLDDAADIDGVITELLTAEVLSA